MIQKTNTINKLKTATIADTSNAQLSQDLKTAVLIVSLLANLFVVTIWIAMQVTSQYDQQLVSFFVNR